ncbi:hypothetical protein KKE06_02460 [Candidatus Micrarchaeota archaeon]|nr:hypothetical protein [Candidatus Micrarchaeota archaeon]MBU1930086.1 hypothetical protein [Candidatus Micrarchaeota archaeon]
MAPGKNPVLQKKRASLRGGRRNRSLVRGARLKAGWGLRVLANKADQHTTSPTVRRHIDRFVRAPAKKVLPKRRTPFLPGEVFVPFREFGNSGPEIELAFRNLRKSVFWKRNKGKLYPAGYFLGAAAISPIAFILPNPLLSLAPGVAAAGGIVAIKIISSKAIKKTSGSIAVVKDFLDRTNIPKLRELADSKKHNFVMADVENNGFRFSKLPPKTLDLVIRLSKEKKGGLIVINSKTGKVVRGTVDGEQIIPASERRGGEERRGSRGDRRQRRKNRRAPPEARETHRF